MHCECPEVVGVLIRALTIATIATRTTAAVATYLSSPHLRPRTSAILHRGAEHMRADGPAR